MKKLVFRKWVVYLILSVSFIAFMVLGSDTENLKVFVITHIGALMVCVINYLLLKKFTNLFD